MLCPRSLRCCPHSYQLLRCVHFEIGEEYIGTRVDKFIRDKYPRVVSYCDCEG